VGGNTSCVAVWGDDAARPGLVLDAGTGIRAVSDLLGGAPFVGTIVLSHLHWDHVQGLPFFAAGDRDYATVRLLMPDEGVDAATTLSRAMSPPHFPIGPGGLRGRWCFETIDTGVHTIDGITVTAIEVPHKGGRTFAYRLDDGHGSLGYVPDHLPPLDLASSALVSALHGVDLLVHDAQFVAGEGAIARAYGHATIDQAVALAELAAVGRLVLFHHAPGRTDEEIDALHHALPTTSFAIDVAIEGATFDVAPRTRRSAACVDRRTPARR